MHVAVIAPPYYELPPTGYGGTERVCHALAEGLVDRGHDVTLIGAGRAHTRARFVAVFSEPQPEGTLDDVAIMVQYAIAAGDALASGDVDVVHDHTLASHLAVDPAMPCLATVHGAVKGPENIGGWIAAVGRRVPLVAISAGQRRQAPGLPWLGCVPNGLLLGEYPVRTDKEDFVLYLGRLNANKGVHLAIDAARAASVPIVIAGASTNVIEATYVDEHIRPRLGPGVEWIGPVGGSEKLGLLAAARCLLFPSLWDEPFGLVVIEALACGTPVVALARGAAPELIADGRTGVICSSASQLADAIDAARSLSPLDCRADALARFDASAMAAGYEQLYERIIVGASRRRSTTASLGGG